MKKLRQLLFLTPLLIAALIICFAPKTQIKPISDKQIHNLRGIVYSIDSYYKVFQKGDTLKQYDSSCLRIKLDEQGNQINQTIKSRSNLNGFLTLFEYDGYNRTESIRVQDSSNQTIKSTIFKYNDRGLVDSIITKNSVNKTNEIVINEYDSLKLMSIKKFKNTSLISHSNFTYDLNKISKFNYKNSELSSVTEFEINHFNDTISSMFIQDIDTVKIKFEYIYDQHNNWTKKSAHHSEYGSLLPQYRNISYYDISNNWFIKLLKSFK